MKKEHEAKLSTLKARYPEGRRPNMHVSYEGTLTLEWGTTSSSALGGKTVFEEMQVLSKLFGTTKIDVNNSQESYQISEYTVGTDYSFTLTIRNPKW